MPVVALETRSRSCWVGSTPTTIKPGIRKKVGLKDTVAVTPRKDGGYHRDSRAEGRAWKDPPLVRV